MQARITVIMGPTASGKTELALSLARRFPFRIISVDSAMVYRGMDIGTAKPDKTTLDRFPHRLIDIRDPGENYSAAEFVRDAHLAIREIEAEGAWPLFVGGTFLYYNALIHGLSELPSANPDIRSRLLDQAQAQGWAHLHEELSKVDEKSAQRIHPNDPQRIQRALEVFYATGKPLSEWYEENRKQPLPSAPVKLILASNDRQELAGRISKRFDEMLNQGLVEEVEALYQRGDLHEDLPSIRCVGYRQVWQYLQGRFSYKEMTERAKAATRQFAKRQFTWLRREKAQSWLQPGAASLTELAIKQLIAEGFKL